jgi:hypothetical protein
MGGSSADEPFGLGLGNLGPGGPRLGRVPYRDEGVDDLMERRDELRAELAAIDARLRQRRRAVARERLACARWDLVGLFTVAGLLFVLSALGWWLMVPRHHCHGGIPQARTDAQNIRAATEMYLAQNPGAACPMVDELVRERILSSRTTTLDPWDTAFVILCDGEDVKVISRGPDRVLGTTDDIE